MQEVLNDLIVLTGYTPADAQLLQSVVEQTKNWSEEITQTFYNTLYGHESTSAVFKDGERAAREETLRNWYHYVSQGKIDDKFWEWQWFVGLVHIPRKVTNPFMLGMNSKIQQIFMANCFATWEPTQAAEIFGAFKRVTDVIAGLIAEGYFQSYLDAMERMSGQSRSLINRMVYLEVDDMIKEWRDSH